MGFPPRFTARSAVGDFAPPIPSPFLRGLRRLTMWQHSIDQGFAIRHALVAMLVISGNRFWPEPSHPPAHWCTMRPRRAPTPTRPIHGLAHRSCAALPDSFLWLHFGKLLTKSPFSLATGLAPSHGVCLDGDGCNPNLIINGCQYDYYSNSVSGRCRVT